MAPERLRSKGQDSFVVQTYILLTAKGQQFAPYKVQIIFRSVLKQLIVSLYLSISFIFAYMKVITVKAEPGYKLSILFDDGLYGTIDLKQFITKGIFTPLEDYQLFSQVYTTGYAVAWNDELEIDVRAIYDEIRNEHLSK